MKKILCNSQRSLITLSLLFFFLSYNATAQDFTDAQRQERCQNNKNRLAELEKQYATVNAELRKIPEKKEIEKARDYMIFIKQFSKYNRIETPEVIRISNLYDMDLKECIDQCYANKPKDGSRFFHYCRISCYEWLSHLIHEKIEKGKAYYLQKPELLRKKSDLEKQIAVHRNNLIALGCDHEELTEESGLNVSATWNFVCCGGTYKGKLTLIQDGEKISGYFGETSNGTTGEISGQISGTSLEFERRWDGKKQDYHLTLSSDGKTLTGNFGGDRNTSVGTDVKATRK